MIVYYDIIADKEVASDSYSESSPCAGIKAIASKRITVQDGEVNIGQNAATEATEDDEGVDAAEVQTVIDIVYGSKLTAINIEKKEFSTLIKQYFKKLLETLDDKKWDTLGVDKEERPADKKLLADLEASKSTGLKAADKAKYEAALKQIADFRAHMESIQGFLKDEIISNFKECEFYTCDDGELGSCMIIPARYVGESTSPIFYFFSDGIKEKKE